MTQVLYMRVEVVLISAYRPVNEPSPIAKKNTRLKGSKDGHAQSLNLQISASAELGMGEYKHEIR